MRFNNFREIKAKFDSRSTDCGRYPSGDGHEIKSGDVIGYAKKYGPAHTMCAACWKKWVAENQAEDMAERFNDCY